MLVLKADLSLAIFQYLDRHSYNSKVQTSERTTDCLIFRAVYSLSNKKFLSKCLLFLSEDAIAIGTKVIFPFARLSHHGISGPCTQNASSLSLVVIKTFPYILEVL